MTRAGDIDFAAVFDALPTPYLVLDADLRIVAANRARELATGRVAAEVVGRHLFDAFPDDPDDPDARSTTLLAQSLHRVLRTGRPDVMPVQRYNIPAAEGGFAQRWWTPVNTPVVDGTGRVELIVHRVHDVTDYMHDRDAVTQEQLETARREIYVQGHALRDALTAEALTARRLAGLVDVARELSGTTTVAELTDVVLRRGLGALDADGGAVAVLAEDGSGLEVTLAGTEEGQAQRLDDLDLRSPVPAAVAASSGEPLVLPDLSGRGAREVPALGDVAVSACVAHPLRVQGRVLGSLTIGWREPQTFTERDLGLIAAFASLCAQALDRTQDHEREQRTVAAERSLSEALQRSLLSEPPRLDGVQIAVRYWPSAEHAEVGGDWYDAFTLSPTTLVAAVGDVAGHDRQAAAAMAQLRNLARGVSVSLHSSPAATLTGLDRAMRTLAVDAVATALVAQLRLRTDAGGRRRLRWSSAGHYPPLLLTPDGTAQLLHTTPDMLLGVAPDTVRRDHEVDLSPGSSVVLYTDGLVERRGRPVQAGLEWLADTLRGRHGESAEALCDLLLDASDGVHDDDVAVLVLRVE
ncbi:SpoIIE family protein phosphatase [Cellulosimicrobium cellulans]|uniref:SpoIIE family protein phosphatase n=1 Tax=Cellulosimicrobium cellulans TaxID=1710 RepID=UPI000848C344|nr:SpoIIE family protein phosphatase [Cellulosimicrobium cellulans]